MIITIPGEFIAALTFPGVIMHEIAHRLMCDIFKVPVYDVNYFSLSSNVVGHVIHQKTNNINQTLLISLAPLFVNSLLCMILTFPFMMPIYVTKEAAPSFINLILLWIGISMGANAFPSNRDVDNVLSVIQENGFYKPYSKISLACNFIKLLNFLSTAWFDLIYAFLVSLILPYLIFG